MIRATLLAIGAACTPWAGLACNLDGSTAEATRTLHGAEVILRNNLARATIAEHGSLVVLIVPEVMG